MNDAIERIGTWAKQGLGRTPEEIRAFEVRMAECCEAGKLASMDAGQRFRRDLEALIGEYKSQGPEVCRTAAIAFIAKRLGDLYGVIPDVDAVRSVVETHGPKAARAAAVEMIREGRDRKVRDAFKVFGKRADDHKQRR